MQRRRSKLALAATLAALAVLGGCGGDRSDPPNIVVVVVDALRADHLGCYGYDRDTSPFLDDFAQLGVLFEHALSQCSQTKPSVASLMTGLNPPSHRVQRVSLLAADEPAVTDVLSEELETLAERLRDAGYATAGFVTNPHLQATQGFAQGFDHYFYGETVPTNADSLNTEVLAWLASPPAGPWFTYVHYMDVHTPYNPPRPYRFLYEGPGGRMKPVECNGPPNQRVSLERLNRTMNLYDGQINYWDDAFKSLVDSLDARGLLENTVVVVTSDHGEEFNEHGGFGHGFTVYEGVIRVPLVVVGAEGQEPGRRRTDPVRLVDVLPTLCRLAGNAAEESGLEGSDVFAPGRDGGLADFASYAEAPFGRAPYSVRKDSDLLIFNDVVKTWEYYDLTRDPFEMTNLWKNKQNELVDTCAELKSLRAGKDVIAPTDPAELDEKTVESLKSLGY